MVEKVEYWEHKYKRIIKNGDIEYEIEVYTSADRPKLGLVIRRHKITKYYSRYIEQMEFYDISEAMELLKELEDVYRKVMKEVYGVEPDEA